VILVLVALACAGAVAFALWVYGRREPPVRGRWLLAGLRAAALVLLVLLLWNPRLPLGGSRASVATPRVLLDASLSMEAEAGEEGSTWERAVERALDESGEGGRVLLFGEGVRSVRADSLRLLEPSDRESRLTPAVQRAAELGAARVRVLTDRRIADPADLTRFVARTGIELSFEEDGEPLRNAGLGELVLPLRVATGDTVTVEVLLHGQGGVPGDSLDLSLEVEGSVRLTRRVPLPRGDRPVRHRLSAPVAGESGIRRVEVRARLSGDAFPRDDRRAAYLEVGAGTGRLLLVSLDPDWEPRYLLPVLEQVTGLEARGFLRIGDDRWLPMGRREERTGPRVTSAVRSDASGAELLVVHGVGGDAPAWIRDALRAAPRTVLLPRDPGGAALAEVRAAGPLPGEWYAVTDLPASPLAGELSGVSFDDLPPLTGVLPVSSPGGGAVPLHLRRGGRGPVEAALLLRADGDGRTAVTLASGFWRWGAREGAPREAYRRLWGGVAGWLLASRGERGDVAAEPRARVLPQGRAVGWRVRGLESDTLRIEIREGSEGAPLVLDTLIDLRGAAPIQTPALPPGTYAYRATGDDPALDARGVLEITAYSDDLLRPLLEPDELSGAGGAEGQRRRRSGGTPLRSGAAPYLLLLGLLCAEWIGRRRTGLR